MPIRRVAASALADLARAYPVVTLTGPRQSGKTTLARMTFDRLPYVSLEPVDTRSYALEDPRSFLDEYRDGAVIDEVQNVPDLLSYLQAVVDDDPTPGRWILTGSQHFGLLEGVSQSLAGRTGIVHLLPLSLEEVRRFQEPPQDVLTTMWMGGYPRIHDRGLKADRWLLDYITTYVQRDVRQVINVGDLEAFTMFVRLCAGRTATELNLSSIGSDGGVSHVTARSWLSALEASFIVFRTPAWRRSTRKRLIKAPKIHFFDSGLVCALLGIHEPEQLRHHPLRGQVFESWVAAEIYKARAHRALAPGLFHLRDPRTGEIDLVVERSTSLAAVEVKSAMTIAADLATAIGRSIGASLPDAEASIVFGGDRGSTIRGVRAIPWSRIQDQRWT